MRRTYQIELKIDFDDESRHDELVPALQRAAQKLLTQATLLADTQRKPQVAIRSEDFFLGNDDINLLPKDDDE